MEFYLDETFEPKTETGKKLKQMVENGGHCDGNIYWLIEKVEELEKENKQLLFVLGKSDTKLIKIKQVIDGQL